MQTRLVQVTNRVQELEQLATDVASLANKYFSGQSVQPDLSIKGEQWYRGARELLANHGFSGLQDFEDCYHGFTLMQGKRMQMFTDIERTFHAQGTIESYRASDNSRLFEELFQKARALLMGLESELLSRELPVVTQLSFTLVASEFEKAQELFSKHSNDETILRATGVIGRIALERHLYTVIEARNLTIVRNPPSKKKPDSEDLLITLTKANVITSVQSSQLRSLLAVGNNCAHPKEAVTAKEVSWLLKDGPQLLANIR